MAERDGPVYSLYFGPRAVVVLANQQVIKEALVTRATEFAGRPDHMLISHITQCKGKTTMCVCVCVCVCVHVRVCLCACVRVCTCLSALTLSTEIRALGCEKMHLHLAHLSLTHDIY